ncbi:aspartate aminotransferase family protein [Arthrobacter sp. CAU 1506]|uniref:pyridoxal phosphate-dependent decarboxylase family protein n=1 Tax=Arthrobacter sp. CAU 1506 TaxID=2560052 RepID=UPI0010AC54B1|nr:aminotransferase class V-fold PLP-dependent enzyme [Arthrobacter sp. CAU 1506]TJY69340.1 aspartate aminotransferase family protein [Arthrobacter sp. CAU 1506]
MWDDELLRRTAELAADYLRSLPDRPVKTGMDVTGLRRELVGELPQHGEDPRKVIEHLADVGGRAAVAMAGPRYFGFVIGGAQPAALAADWLTSTWDQNAGLYVAGPAASVVEEAVGEWLLDLFGLPPDCGYGLVTGCQMAHFTCLAAARTAVLERAGWDVVSDGLFGAPEIAVVLGEEAHSTVLSALQYLGLGRRRIHLVDTDEQGRITLESLDAVLERIPESMPLIVNLQAGNVNTGSFDPFASAVERVRRREGAWVHVDGAFGLWAAANPGLRHLLDGVELADSWATDAHKWLNVPYDSGIAIVRDSDVHQRTMSPPHAAYLEYGQERDEVAWVPEFSRRARGFPAYAALRTLGRAGVSDLVGRCCTLAARMAGQLAGAAGVQILNDVVLNQVLVRFTPEDGSDPDEFTREVVHRVQEDGTLWLSGTTWHGMAAMRISVCNWSTTEEDADRSVEAILRCAR